MNNEIDIERLRIPSTWEPRKSDEPFDIEKFRVTPEDIARLEQRQRELGIEPKEITIEEMMDAELIDEVLAQEAYDEQGFDDEEDDEEYDPNDRSYFFDPETKEEVSFQEVINESIENQIKRDEEDERNNIVN